MVLVVVIVPIIGCGSQASAIPPQGKQTLVSPVMKNGDKKMQSMPHP